MIHAVFGSVSVCCRNSGSSSRSLSGSLSVPYLRRDPRPDPRRTTMIATKIKTMIQIDEDRDNDCGKDQPEPNSCF